MWHFECGSHTLVIEMVRPGEYALLVDHRLLGCYSRPTVAAKNLPCAKTGESAWNCTCDRQIPLSLTDWEAGAPCNYFAE